MSYEAYSYKDKRTALSLVESAIKNGLTIVGFAQSLKLSIEEEVASKDVVEIKIESCPSCGKGIMSRKAGYSICVRVDVAANKEVAGCGYSRMVE